MAAYDEGRQAHKDGKELTENPFAPETPDHEAWANGWQDNAAESSPATPPDGDPPTEESSGEGAAAAAAGDLVPDFSPLGDEGWSRVMELLENPPVEVTDAPVPGFNDDVPSETKEWLEAFKAPLVLMAADTVTGALRARLTQTDRGRLKELYRQMSPAELTAVMQGNVEAISQVADERAREALMLENLKTKLSAVATRYLLKLVGVAALA